MNNVKRYDAHTSIDDFKSDWHEVKDGPMVKHSDYELLKQQFDAVVAENVALKKFCKNAAFDADDIAEMGMERGGFTDALNDINTPATEAALAEVEAKAIDGFADMLGKLYQCEKPTTARAKAFKHVVFLAVNYAKELREVAPNGN
ncbi:hypothetical protein [Serratia sp. UGAL515B_01]|uniref:hypothetical protein n=1 Tax=Serratia sp. UGAL515B_01 TaxID=2986763 RepID=UPI002955B819|nr:hypothetical protein [Serratia sp. UGAL515B_01]WON77540.1 hypothetical protein OK023_02205 [Serratia sp. UGAL515B_01]